MPARSLDPLDLDVTSERNRAYPDWIEWWTLLFRSISRLWASRNDAADEAQISFIPFKLACPFLPTMMWSCTEMPSGPAMSTMAFVIWMSACDGVGSPEG